MSITSSLLVEFLGYLVYNCVVSEKTIFKEIKLLVNN